MPTKKKAKYKVTVAMPSAEYSAEGKDVHEALDNLGLSYLDVKEKGTITLQKGNKKAERFFYKNPLKRVVVNKLRKAQVGRDLESLLQ